MLYEAAVKLKEVLRGRAALLLTDRADIATAVAAEGVVLSDQGLPTVVARRMLQVSCGGGRIAYCILLVYTCILTWIGLCFGRIGRLEVSHGRKRWPSKASCCCQVLLPPSSFHADVC